MVESLLTNMPLLLLIVGLVLMAMEAVSPGAHFIVIGVALVGAGLVGVIFPPFAAPLVLAGLVLAIGAVATWIYREFDFYGGKGTDQTKDSSSLSGATGFVTETITARSGRVKLSEGGFNPYYSARTSSGTIEEGDEVIVIDPGGGNVLSVEPLTTVEEDEIDRELARDRAQRSTPSSGSKEREASSKSEKAESADELSREPATDDE